ncbi:MAG: IS256 family transposase [Candidatus Omnitrophica bacterium]|nr:IS256 family transposase [Candidatus Omnitrophota bacterium]
MKDLDFTKDNLTVQWKYVKRNLLDMGVGVTDKFESEAHKAIQSILQRGIDEEFNAKLGARRYERTSNRQGVRKGSYARSLTTTFGRSELMVPRVRGKIDTSFKMFNKYQRRHDKFDEMVLMSLMLGLSTRKQRKFFKSFIGDSVSHATASRLLRRFEEDLKVFRTQRIKDEYKYLLIDGIWVKVKEREVRKRPVILVIGIKNDGTKEILTFKLARSESEQEVTGILNDLYRRGLEGKNLRLIASDGARGIRAAIEMVYPYAKWQWCYTHKLRNVSKRIKHKVKNRRSLMRDASRIYKAGSRREALTRFNQFYKKWKDREPTAAKNLKKDFADTLSFYDYIEDKRFISTTNHLERYIEEIRRRIKIQGFFKNSRSVDYWVYGIIQHIDSVKQPKGEPSSPMGEDIKELKYESAQLS